MKTNEEQAPITNGRWSGYRRLLQMRMHELWREPEVIFWVFVFPLLLALGLGIAFRNKPAEVTPVAVVEGPKAQEVMDLLQRSPGHAALHVDVLSAAEAYDGFRLGKYSLVVNRRRIWHSLPLRSGAARERTGPCPGG